MYAYAADSSAHTLAHRLAPAFLVCFSGQGEREFTGACVSIRGEQYQKYFEMMADQEILLDIGAFGSVEASSLSDCSGKPADIR